MRVVLALVSCLGLGVALGILGSIEKEEEIHHEFNVSQCVQVVLSSEAGMVVKQYAGKNLYDVRIAIAFASGDERYPIVQFRGYELQKCTP